MISFTNLHSIIATVLPFATVIGSVRNIIRIPIPHIFVYYCFLIYVYIIFFVDLCEYDSCFIFTNTLLITVPFKGTVRPDWICMRVVSLESPLKGHQPLYVFNFLFLILNI
jgi:hypothetical protein